MKKILSLLAVFILCNTTVYAIDRGRVVSSSDFTGESMSFNTVSVSSATTATTLAAYSTSRGALTVINVSTNTVTLSTSSAIGQSITLPAGQSIQFRNNSALFGQVAAGIAVMSVGVVLEW